MSDQEESDVHFVEIVLDIDIENVTPELLEKFKVDLAKVLGVSPDEICILGVRPGGDE